MRTARATPALPGSAAAILFPFPAATPEIDLAAPIVEARPTAGGRDPAGRRGARGARHRGGGRSDGGGRGGTMTVNLGARAVVARHGRRDRRRPADRPERRADLPRGEVFTTKQLASAGAARARSASSATAGSSSSRRRRQPGYSVGLTNFELAQALVRLGAVTGMALDSGGSTTMAFDGTLLNRPRTGPSGESRPADVPLPRRLRARAACARLAERRRRGRRAEPRYRVVRPSSVTVTLRAPDGSTPVSTTAQQAPGSYPVPFRPSAAATPGTGAPSPPVPGRSR
jgi:hypothetical protein